MKQYMDLLGRKVRDKVTGFEGVVTSICFDLYGCVQVIVHPEMKDGSKGDPNFFDHKRLEITDSTPVMELPNFDAPLPQADPKPLGQEPGPAEKPGQKMKILAG